LADGLQFLCRQRTKTSKNELVIAAISQLAAKAPQTGAPTANAGSSADIFLSLLTQEFQTSNGLIDPSLANLNPKQTTANAAELTNADSSKADPNAAEGNTQVTGNATFATKKLGDKDKGQSSKADDATPVATIATPTISVISTPVPVQVQPQQPVNTTADQTNASTDDAKKVSGATQFAGVIASGKNNDLQVNTAFKNSALKQAQATQAQDVNATDDNQDGNVSAISSSAVSGKDSLQASDIQANAKVAAGVMKPLNSVLPAMEHAAPGNALVSNQEKQVPSTSDLTQLAVAPDATAATNNAQAIAANPAVTAPTPTATQPNVADNKFAGTDQAGPKDSDSTVQLSGVSDGKSKDSVAAAKSTFKKDEGQLNQQDSQQAPAQTVTNDSQVITSNSTFHSAVAQQIHTATTASNATQHSQTNAKTNLPSNNLQSASQQIAGTAAHDATLPAGSGPLQSAKLVERLGQAELRVGVQVGDMGGVDIRTSITHNQLTAEISVEHSELGHMLAANLPSLQNKLSEHQIQTANITFQNQMSGNSSQSEQRSRQGNSSQPQTPIERIPYGEAENFSRMSASSSEAVEGQSGLDIHI
jgi:hypothetical protein